MNLGTIALVTGAGLGSIVVVVLLVVCCLAMMFGMRGMGSNDRPKSVSKKENQREIDLPPNKNDSA